VTIASSNYILCFYWRRIVAKLLLICLPLLAAIAACTGRAVAQECSTEKVNGDCNVTIDRSYPVVVPTIQMRPGKKVTVKIVHPLPFENLSVDLQSAQAIAGTDQTAGFVTAALPNLKGLVLQTDLYSSKQGIQTALDGGELPSITKYKTDLANLYHAMNTYIENAATIYAQLNEVLGPMPPQLLPRGQRLPSSKVPQDFPRPWIRDDYARWRSWMLCEIGDKECPGEGEPAPSVRALLANGASMVNALGPCPKLPDPLNSQLIACQIAAIQTEIGAMPKDDQAFFSPFLQALSADSAVLSADSAAIVAVNKDLGNYWANIDGSRVIAPPDPLADILDPLDKNNGKNLQLQKLLGRQVAFALNAVNEVGTFVASVPAATQKKSIATITVVYGDPIFEVSAGAFFSTLPNRSFANKTIVAQNPGSTSTLGNIIIDQTISRPTIVPFVAANWRLGHNFAWPDHRRGAFYFTAAIGLNPNNTTTEFGLGPSFSWRAVMFSTLFHLGHDVRLTQGEQVGEVWCNSSAANGSIPKCSGNPPSPSTEKFWKGAFAFCISVRVPSVFGGGK
jgi:hypothetical protein